MDLSRFDTGDLVSFLQGYTPTGCVLMDTLAAAVRAELEERLVSAIQDIPGWDV